MKLTATFFKGIWLQIAEGRKLLDSGHIEFDSELRAALDSHTDACAIEIQHGLDPRAARAGRTVRCAPRADERDTVHHVVYNIVA